MVNKFTKENVIDLLYDKDNIKTDKDKIDCNFDEDELAFEITAPIFISDYIRNLDLNFWVHLDYRIEDGQAVLVPFHIDEFKKNAMFSVSISDSCDPVEDMDESELEELIFKSLALNNSFLNECKEVVIEHSKPFIST